MVVFVFIPEAHAKEKTFTIVIDPGHGGKDPGAIGYSAKEKTINLAVALLLGDMIETEQQDTRVVYTRKTDRFIELDERANIANRNKADLFISIHANSVKRGSSVSGTETFTLGLARTQENLEVAMRENSAILLEDNYLQKYEGFDPTSTESYIIFEFMQNKHMEQSIDFASSIQKEFVKQKRANRGVKQGGLLVLRKTSMPAVLVELGFISNREEERFMASVSGQKKLAKALYSAFTRFKSEYDRKRGVLSVNESQSTKNNFTDVSSEKPVITPQKAAKVVYKIQILASDKKIADNSKEFKGYKNIDFYKEKGLYKYTYGESTDFNEIRLLRRKMAKDFKDAFIIEFVDGVKVNR
ncbi:N-acetylmuramoyl-L-alanine amidase [Massilibacteroides sp.]|uniref:N-acetylmuramoyl-L-alanine amidase family protein n=1 Tax=Massilibacteroides sp. TaxID=2034766 RepID=UPI00261C8C87|nr:N-acetylmuramoyl-L-alanine amidase [Massilibacteroides sp.]MDD4515815.1 N-acetylmuramoyl-L-alanine amidase [Massilibacteroides sp.]